MLYRRLIAAGAFVTALGLSVLDAQAFDESKYPSLKGQWERIGSPRWDDAHAPLTPEYRAIWEASLKDMAQGGQGVDPTYTCIPPGMPRIMNVYDPMEIVVTPKVAYILIQHINDMRRIYTDGRPWPKDIDPTFAGYAGVAGGELRRRQPPCPDREGELFPERRRLPDAGEKRPGAPRSEIFQAEVMSARLRG
jgi:hypothetical protein